MTSTQKTITIAAVVLGSLLAGGTIAVVIALNANTAASQEQDYRQCMAAAGVYETDDPDAMIDMAESCHLGVYGE